jgi:hypothetical protein
VAQHYTDLHPTSSDRFATTIRTSCEPCRSHLPKISMMDNFESVALSMCDCPHGAASQSRQCHRSLPCNRADPLHVCEVLLVLEPLATHFASNGFLVSGARSLRPVASFCPSSKIYLSTARESFAYVTHTNTLKRSATLGLVRNCRSWCSRVSR